jgi:hypothetical protein
MITAFAKDALYNLWYWELGCAGCIQRCCKSEARPAMRAKLSMRCTLDI